MLAFGLRCILLDTERSDTRDKIVRDRFVEGEPKISLLSCVWGNGFLNINVTGNRRIKTYVTLEGREVDKKSVLLDCRHSIANDFLCIRGGFENHLTHALKNGLDFWCKALDVLVNTQWCSSAGVHGGTILAIRKFAMSVE